MKSKLIALIGLLSVTIATATDLTGPLFKGKELSVEAAYTVRTEDLDKFNESTTVGLNYFVTPNAGFHAGVGLDDLSGQGIDVVEFGLVGRIPFEKFRTSLQFGIGAEHYFVNSTGSRVVCDKESKVMTPAIEDSWAVYAEAGPVVRLNQHLDVFAKVRGIRPIEGSNGEHIGIFVGLAIPFTLFE